MTATEILYNKLFEEVEKAKKQFDDGSEKELFLLDRIEKIIAAIRATAEASYKCVHRDSDWDAKMQKDISPFDYQLRKEII